MKNLIKVLKDHGLDILQVRNNIIKVISYYSIKKNNVVQFKYEITIITLKQGETYINNEKLNLYDWLGY